MLVEKALQFVRAIEAWRPVDEIEPLVTDDFRQEEMPNPFNKRGAVRGLTEIRESLRRGEALIAGQDFTVERHVEAGNTVMLELVWTGSLRVRVGEHAEGTALRARVAQVYEFEAGRIARLRSYDCYDPL